MQLATHNLCCTTQSSPGLIIWNHAYSSGKKQPIPRLKIWVFQGTYIYNWFSSEENAELHHDILPGGQQVESHHRPGYALHQGSVQFSGHESEQGTQQNCSSHFCQDTCKQESCDLTMWGWTELPRCQHFHKDVVAQLHQKTNRTGGILYLDYNKHRVSRIEPVLQFKQAKFIEYPSGWLLVTSSRWFKLHTFTDEPASVAQVSHKP